LQAALIASDKRIAELEKDNKQLNKIVSAQRGVYTLRNK